MVRLGFGAFAAFAALGLAQDLHPVSVEQERALSQRIQSDFEAEHRLSEDEAVLAYVSRLGAKVDSRFVYRVLATTDIFATAFPQGHVYVTTGLLLRVRDEAELAGVLAHESAHSAMPLEWRKVSRYSIPLMVSGANGGVCLRFGSLWHYSVPQDREVRADLDAAQLLRNAAYSPVAMLDFFEQFLPPAGDLSSERSQLAASVPAEAVVTTSAFEAMQARLKRPVPRLN